MKVGIKAKHDLYAVLTPEQRQKQNALRNQMRLVHRTRMFSSQGMSTTNAEKSADGTTSGPETTPLDTEKSLQSG